MKKDWTNDFFIKKGKLFLEVMNLLWKRAPQDTKAIDQLIKKHNPQAKDILEIMCGNGRISINLAKTGYNVTGMDINKMFIEDAKKKAKENNVENKVNFIQGDVRKLDKYFNQNTFDIILSIWTSIGYYGEKEDTKIFKKAWKITKPNSLLLILNTASRERILKNYCPKHYEESEKLLILHDYTITPESPIMRDQWRYYRKNENKLKYLGEATTYLQLYSYHEIIKILKTAGWETIETLDNIETMEKAKTDSPINIIARKID